jgi:hypothetical protein
MSFLVVIDRVVNTLAKILPKFVRRKNLTKSLEKMAILSCFVQD